MTLMVPFEKKVTYYFYTCVAHLESTKSKNFGTKLLFAYMVAKGGSSY